MNYELYADPAQMQEPWGAIGKNSSLAPPSVKASAVRRIRINHTAYINAVDFAQRTFDKFSCFEDPGGGRIIAQSGGGKSSIVEHMTDRYPQIDTPEYLSMPVLAITTKPGARIGSLLDSMLGRCSFHLPHSKMRGNQDLAIYIKIDNLIDALKRCHVRLIMVDEFSHIGERKQGTHSKEITDTFKLIYDETRIGQIFLGEQNANLPFEQNAQFETRLPGKIEIPLFECDAEFYGVLDSFDEQLPMRHPAGLASGDISLAIHDATRGQMRSIVKLLAEAVYIASADNKDRILIEHLREAYESINGADPKRPNPFSKLRK